MVRTALMPLIKRITYPVVNGVPEITAESVSMLTDEQERKL